MNCEQAQVLLSARLDGELTPEDRARLEVHLGECAACRAADGANRLLDADLRRAFARRRQAAARVGERVVALLPALPVRRAPVRLPWLGMVAAAAAGFGLAIVLFHPWQKPETVPPAGDARPAVQLALAVGPVEVQAPGRSDWREVRAGALVDVGWRVRTGPNTWCEFRTPDGSEVRLDTGTELVFEEPRQLHLSQGQILALVARAEGPFAVHVPEGTVTALGTLFNVLCKPAETVVTVLEGATELQTDGATEDLKAGERARMAHGRVSDKEAVEHLVLATSWANELRVRKSRDSAELSRRVDDVLAQIGQTKASYLDDSEIRALGDHCVLPLTKFIESERSRQPAERDKRVRAARLLADLAQPWSIPELIKLLDDSDADVRYYAANGLQRLTGVSQGIELDAWRRKSREQLAPAREKWQNWWRDNRQRYPTTPGGAG